MPKQKIVKTGNCELEVVKIVIECVTLRSWTGFDIAFAEAANFIPRKSYLWDVNVNHSPDCGYEVKLYFLKSVK